MEHFKDNGKMARPMDTAQVKTLKAINIRDII
jgi:hypothetical protein